MADKYFRVAPRSEAALARGLASLKLGLGRRVSQENYVGATWLYFEGMAPADLAEKLGPYVAIVEAEKHSDEPKKAPAPKKKAPKKG